LLDNNRNNSTQLHGAVISNRLPPTRQGVTDTVMVMCRKIGAVFEKSCTSSSIDITKCNKTRLNRVSLRNAVGTFGPQYESSQAERSIRAM